MDILPKHMTTSITIIYKDKGNSNIQKSCKQLYPDIYIAISSLYIHVIGHSSLLYNILAIPLHKVHAPWYIAQICKSLPLSSNNTSMKSIVFTTNTPTNIHNIHCVGRRLIRLHKLVEEFEMG